MMVRAVEVLSDRERRELELIERHLAEEDPELARTLRTAMVARGSTAWMLLAVLLGGVALFGALTGSSGMLLAGLVCGAAAWWLRHRRAR